VGGSILSLPERGSSAQVVCFLVITGAKLHYEGDYYQKIKLLKYQGVGRKEENCH
jgi:hypothetical protein